MKIAFVSLTSCEGCLYNLVREELFTLLNRYCAEIAYWRTLGVKTSDEYDVAVVEGSITCEKDAEHVRKVREKSKILIALGSCSVLGGVQGRIKCGDSPRSTPLSDHIEVDYVVRGCPADFNEFITLLEKILAGTKPVIREKRFDLVRREAFKIIDQDGFMVLDTSKCIVCGRCVEICKKIGAFVLNYVGRGISTVISTPYSEPFSRTNCIYCGLCVAYCPAGSVYYTLRPEKPLNYVGSPVYVELEALTSIAESENVSIEQVVSALKLIGFSEVIVYSNLSHIRREGVYAKSIAEYSLAKKFIPEPLIELVYPRVPANALYVTQCVGWRKLLRNAVTAREVQLLLKAKPVKDLAPSPPDQILYHRRGDIVVVESVEELVTSIHSKADKAVVFEVCPGGCLMGGGQPTSSINEWNDVFYNRSLILENFLKKYLSLSLN